MEKKKNYHVHLTLDSLNSKTGRIPVSVTESSTCPPTCAFKGEGCFAENGHLRLHWAKVDAGERGMSWDMFCEAIGQLPPGQLWRHNAAGDLPGGGGLIDHEALGQLVQANAGRRGFTYTHYLPQMGSNDLAIARANLEGFAINLSADSIEEADRLADLGIGPVVCVLPSTATKNCKTPAGRTVVVCPATQQDFVTCSTCQLCYHQRETIVGFPAHGSRLKRIDIRLAQAA